MKSEVKLGPCTEAMRIGDSVSITEKCEGRFNSITIDKEDWEKIGELFGNEGEQLKSD